MSCNNPDSDCDCTCDCTWTPLEGPDGRPFHHTPEGVLQSWDDQPSSLLGIKLPVFE